MGACLLCQVMLANPKKTGDDRVPQVSDRKIKDFHICAQDENAPAKKRGHQRHDLARIFSVDVLVHGNFAQNFNYQRGIGQQADYFRREPRIMKQRAHSTGTGNYLTPGRTGV
jgi:hypothetical protein